MVKLGEISYFKVGVAELSIDPFARLDFDYFYNIELFKNQFEKKLKFKRIRDVVSLIETGHPVDRTDYSPFETEYIHIVPRDIKDGYLQIKEPIYLTEEKGEELKDFRLDKDDVLMAISSNVGESAIFLPPTEDVQYTISHYVVRMKVKPEEYDKDFLTYYLNHPKIKLYFRAIEAGKTQQNLSKVYLRNMPIIDISIDEQVSIVKDLKKNDDEIRKKKMEIDSIKGASTKKMWDTITFDRDAKLKASSINNHNK